MFTETKTQEKCSLNLLTIPYSIQETSCGPEDVLSIEPPSTSSESLEVQDVISTKDETSTDDCAEVKVEEVQLVEKETKHRTVLRRFVHFFVFFFLPVSFMKWIAGV